MRNQQQQPPKITCTKGEMEELGRAFKTHFGQVPDDVNRDYKLLQSNFFDQHIGYHDSQGLYRIRVAHPATDVLASDHPWNDYGKLCVELYEHIAAKVISHAPAGDITAVQTTLDTARNFSHKPFLHIIFFAYFYWRDPQEQKYYYYDKQEKQHDKTRNTLTRRFNYDIANRIEQYLPISQIDFLMYSAFAIEMIQQNRIEKALVAVEKYKNQCIQYGGRDNNGETHKENFTKTMIKHIPQLFSGTLSVVTLAQNITHHTMDARQRLLFKKEFIATILAGASNLENVYHIHGFAVALIDSHPYLRYSEVDFPTERSYTMHSMVKNIIAVLSTPVPACVEDTLQNRYQTYCETLIKELRDGVTSAKNAGNRHKEMDALLPQLNTIIDNTESLASQKLFKMIEAAVTVRNTIRSSFSGRSGRLFHGSKTADVLEKTLIAICDRIPTRNIVTLKSSTAVEQPNPNAPYAIEKFDDAWWDEKQPSANTSASAGPRQ